MTLGKSVISFVLLLLTALVGCARITPPPGVTPVYKVLVTTGYCKCGRCCGWQRTWWGRPVYSYGPLKGEPKRVGITASGTVARPGTIAADTSRYPFGTIMYIEGYGYGRVEDRGRDIQGDHIDLFFRTHREAEQWGVRRARVVIWFRPGTPVGNLGQCQIAANQPAAPTIHSEEQLAAVRCVAAEWPVTFPSEE
ncbi:MAG: 3D domain-containing protein [Verrucomicrobiae bacterium]|nr:3D domain-containing protein [Verrucomicrobiae bacterium]